MLEVNRDSWHYRMARVGGLDEYEDQIDLCNYAWAILWAATWPTLVVAFGAAVAGVMVLLPLVMLAVRLMYGPFEPETFGIAGLVLWGYALVLLGYLALCAHLRSHKRRSPSKAGELVQAAYRGWKDKACVLIAVKD